jgi:hypothetical protein
VIGALVYPMDGAEQQLLRADSIGPDRLLHPAGVLDDELLDSSSFVEPEHMERSVSHF